MLLAQRAQFAKAQHYVPQKSCQTISASTLRRPCTAPPRQPSAGHVRVRCQLSGTVTAVRDPTSTGSDASAPSGNTKAAGDAAATTQKLPPRTPYVPSGPPETTWYCWPEGFIGQSFSLAGKLQPRASPLLEDVDTLYQFTVRRRESCRYTEHTVDSSESASEMVEAVVGGAVDMGLFNASGSASLSMSREYSSRAVSHALVASFQENELLEMVKPSLTDAAKKVLMTEGPYAFAARYGTHFVSGVGHRGAFIGSITVKLSDMQLAAAASASFKASYGACSGMAELKGEMNNKLSTSNVTFRWHKWGVEDDESLTLLEQYCASEDAKFAGMRVLAMHTADQAKGYPKLIKLRPYSTLPDYVEACSRYCKEHSQQDDLQLQDIEQALAYLTKQYRKASYIKQVIDNDRRLGDMNSVGLAGTKDSLAHQVKVLVRYMEEVFKSKPEVSVEMDSPPGMYHLCAYFKYFDNNIHTTTQQLADKPEAGRAFELGRRIKEKLDDVDRLNFELFKAVQRPLLPAPRGPAPERFRRDVQVAVACNASKGNGAFGCWWLNFQLQETFTKKGLYVVRLAWDDGKLRQVGRTQYFDATTAPEAAAADPPGKATVKSVFFDPFLAALTGADSFIKAGFGDDGKHTGIIGKDNVFITFVVGVSPAVDTTNAQVSKALADITYKPWALPAVKPPYDFGSWAFIVKHTPSGDRDVINMVMSGSAGPNTTVLAEDQISPPADPFAKGPAPSNIEPPANVLTMND